MSRLQELVADTVSNRLFRTMRVTQVSERGPFREISLTSGASWAPGDKIQVHVTREESDGHLPVLVEHVVVAAEHRESPLGAPPVPPWLARRRRRASLN